MISDEFKLIKEYVTPDSRGRVNIGVATKDKSYRVLQNAEGEILMIPVVSVPERELWLYQNPEALAAVKQGISEAESGLGRDMGDLSEYLDLEIED